MTVMNRAVSPASIVIGILMAVSAGGAMAHGGGIDQLGCHRDSRAGNYHCHSGPLAGQSFSSKTVALQILRKNPGIGTQPAGGQNTFSNTSSDGSEKEGGKHQYDRHEYLSSWRDRNGDCQDTREEVLIRQSIVPVTFKTARGCDVIAGQWRDPYSGKTFTNPSKLDIDHLVPLAEVDRSGGSEWPASRKHQYANDIEHQWTLIAVYLGENRSKGADDPANWMPSNDAFACQYLERWVAVKRQWGLSMDEHEKAFVRKRQRQCQ